jgi:hypothetical protein
MFAVVLIHYIECCSELSFVYFFCVLDRLTMVSPVSAKVISQLHKTEEKYMFVCTVRCLYTVQWYI